MPINSWVAFQTGFLKANYPAEFMAAVLSRNINDTNKLTTYMDECKAMGISVKGPDINESGMSFSVTSAGDIRFGLSAIKGVGSDVVNKIISARADGPFKDIYDFVERVPSGALNRRVFDGLTLAGAFDCFHGIKREDLVAEIGKRGETASEILLRYGGQYQNARTTQSASLFGFDDDSLVEASRPPLPHAPEWSDLARLNRERELVGMYLSAHPLDPFRVEVEYGADCSIAEKNEMTQPMQSLAIAGMIMEVNERTTRAGGSMTIVKIEDFSGSTDFAVFERQMAGLGGLLVPGTPVMVYGQLKTDRNGALRFNVEKVRRLAELHGRLFRTLNIILEPSQADTVAALLETPVKDGSEVEPVDVVITVHDPGLQRKLTFNTTAKVHPTAEFVRNLRHAEVAFRLERSRQAM